MFTKLEAFVNRIGGFKAVTMLQDSSLQFPIEERRKIHRVKVFEVKQELLDVNYVHKLSSRYSTSKRVKYKACRKSARSFWKHML